MLGTKAYSVSPLFSKSAISNATITLSLTTCSRSSKNCLKISSTPSSSPRLPRASAASCLTILASSLLLKADTSAGIDAGCDNWPNTNAISCRKSAEGSWKPLARARIAGIAVGRSGGDAKSLRPNMALYLRNRGCFVSSNDFSSSSIDGCWEFCGSGGAGSIEAKLLLNQL